MCNIFEIYPQKESKLLKIFFFLDSFSQGHPLFLNFPYQIIALCTYKQSWSKLHRGFDEKYYKHYK